MKNNEEHKNTEEISSPNLKSKALSVFKSEVLKIGALVFVSIILLVFTIPIFFNNSALKFQITQKVSQITQASFNINGDVKVAFLPSPAVIAKDVVLRNYRINSKDPADKRVYNLYAKSVKIKFPIFKFSNDVFAREITFSDVAAEGYYESDSTARANKVTAILAEFAKLPPAKEGKSASGISAQLFSFSGLDAMKLKPSNVAAVKIENGELAIYDHLGMKREIKLINADFEISDDETEAEGSFSSENILNNFTLLAKFNSKSKKPNSKLEVISSALKLRVKGNFTSENKGFLESDFKGKIELEILELKSFYQSYISNNGIVANKLRYNAKPIKISADIENKEGEVAINKINLNSSLVNGSGDINLNLGDKIPLIDINLDIENFDLDSIWSQESVAMQGALPAQEGEVLTTDEAETLPQIPPVITTPDDVATPATATVPAVEIKKTEIVNLNLTKKIKDFDLTAEIKIKNTKYLEGEIKDADLYLTISKEGEILVLPLIFRIPGEGIFRVNGALDNSSIMPKFVGKFDASGKNLSEIFKWLKIESQNLKYDNLRQYSLYSDILLLPNSATLNNFYLNLNNGSSEFLGELKIDSSSKISNIISRFKVSNLNLDDYFLTSAQNIYFSPGSLLKKLLWLNNISIANDISLNFDKLTYKKEEFPDQSIKLRFGRGYIELVNLVLKSTDTDLKAALSIDISDKNPKFEISIDADNFLYTTIQKSELLPDDSVKKSSRNFFDQFFALPSLEGFNGKVSLNFKSLKLDDLEIKNAKLDGKLKDGNIENSILAGDIYDGNLSYKGMLGIKLNKTINGNLSLDNASLRPLLDDLFGIKNVSGIVNIAASITSVASVKEEFSKQLVSEVKFTANSPTVEGYGLNDLVRKMFSPQSYINELRQPQNILINPEAITIFKQASGTVQINNGKDGKLRINVSAPAINGILAGSFKADDRTADLLFNAIFLTGSRQKQTPINIAINLKGNTNNLMQSSNIDQVRQYLGLPVEAKPATPSDNNVVNSAAPTADQPNNIPTEQSQDQPAQQQPVQQQPVQNNQIVPTQ